MICGCSYCSYLSNIVPVLNTQQKRLSSTFVYHRKYLQEKIKELGGIGHGTMGRGTMGTGLGLGEETQKTP